mmetsp:Transcript_43912/g.102472  ORF Transcript_43912/g.102472 Transcript_43912/m.102472 type:complete len:214 (+) Transcript_43912:179-820(+)
MTAMVVHRCFLAACVTTSTTEWEVVESNPLVGSSRKSNEGLATNSIAMETRFRCPPDTPFTCSSPIAVFRNWESPNPSCSRMSVVAASHCLARATREVMPSSRGSRSWAWNETFSSTVRFRCITSSCGTKPVTERSSAMDRPSPQVPLIWMLPWTWPYPARPLKTFMMEDFPQPLGPITATVHPAGMSRLMPLKITWPLGSSSDTLCKLKLIP